MASDAIETESISRSKSAPAGTSRPTLTLRNEATSAHSSFQSVGPLVPPTRRTQRIPTFFPWSIFNLLFVPFGILCCYFSHKVSQFKIQNRHDAAVLWSKRTFVVNIITTLLMIGVIITVVMLHYDYEQRKEENVGNQTRTTGSYIPWQPGR
ncbi:unnamed protein product [Adineta ricciae]|uniref:Uncharacterized protein n=1 Tax=Adineta ricciae TaxID=249248 RepID=A0A814ZX75_ADIRI|nr:unnamed protein product [Adineta ricciae]CAF1248861.1 unnamed protein product [Adineta ricciae]